MKGHLSSVEMKPIFPEFHFDEENVFHLHLTSEMHGIILMEYNCIVCCHYFEQSRMSSHSSGVHFEVNEGPAYRSIQAFKTNISIHSGLCYFAYVGRLL